MTDIRRSEVPPVLATLADQLVAADPHTAHNLIAGFQGSAFDLAGTLKARADHLLRVDVQGSLRCAAVLELLANSSDDRRIAALAALVAANAHSIGLGDYHTALSLYDHGVALYQQLGLAIESAQAQIGRIWTLACLGRHEEALAAGASSAAILRAHAQWKPLATLTMNLSAIHGRLGHDAETLALLDSALAICDDLGPDGDSLRPLVEQNRAIVLRNLGDFAQAESASQRAYDLLSSAGQPVEAARALRNLAAIALLLGRYNEALRLLDRARERFEHDGRAYDALVVAIEISECLLRLRRFSDVLTTRDRVRERFTTQAQGYELAQVCLQAAAALAGLQRYAEALDELNTARELFAAAGTTALVGACELERATILIALGDRTNAYITAESSMVLFREHGLPLGETRAGITAALAADDPELARALANEALAAANLLGVPELAYQCRLLLGRIARAAGDQRAARDQLDQAVELIERLRGSLMVEFRPGYVEDKQGAYDELIALCLAAGDAAGALAYAERAPFAGTGRSAGATGAFAGSAPLRRRSRTGGRP
ncbi:MAG: tetratricopeptide repeat protein [Oscillochloris sp.]|nr:tetratricopeptide repeat protein [Oscillochloris sp.]